MVAHIRIVRDSGSLVGFKPLVPFARKWLAWFPGGEWIDGTLWADGALAVAIILNALEDGLVLTSGETDL